MLAVLCASLFAAPLAASEPPQATQSGSSNQQTGLVGHVVDARSGEPLQRVLVLVEGTRLSTVTDASGRFELRGIAPGSGRLYVSVVGYAVGRRPFVAAPGRVLDLTIALTEGTTSYHEIVTVTTDAFRTLTDPIPSGQILGSAELVNLRGVLADDPLRAVQVLPGVAAGDDYRSEFTVRGSDFRHLTFTVDGFSTPFLLHTLRGVEDRGPSGSVAMINSDILEDVTLLNGGYPQRFGGHTGAEVDFRLRDGSRERKALRVSVSGTSASVVAEGPLGSARQGSWLISGRQSYLDLLVHRLTTDALSFGFADAQGKVAYDLTPRQRVDVAWITGRSRFENDPDRDGIDAIATGTNASVIGIASWRIALPRAVLTERVLAAENHFRNENPSAVELDRGRDRQLSVRSEITAAAAAHVQLESGAEIERWDDSRLRRRFSSSRQSLVLLDDYRGHDVRSGAYVSTAWRPLETVTISPGVRADWSSLAGATTASPWVQGEWRLASESRLRAAAGEYRQFPDFDQVLGVSGGRALRAERAMQYDLGFERRIRPELRISVTAYDREESGMLRRAGSEFRVIGSRIVRGSPTSNFENRLDGAARGVELLLQRRSAYGLSGWVSYAYARVRYVDVLSGERFWGDADQRHTLNASAVYRRSDRASFVSKLRIGSNFPVPGYYASRDGSYFVTDVRNTARLPTYARLDFRANRTFNRGTRRFTLFAEVINVLNRSNVRFDPPAVNPATRQATRPFDTLLPIVPSLGLMIEF